MLRRELVEPQPDDKRYARRNRKGQFTESDDVGRSLSQDRRRKAKRVAPKGQGAAATGSAFKIRGAASSSRCSRVLDTTPQPGS
jgi:hypothetical protein